MKTLLMALFCTSAFATTIVPFERDFSRIKEFAFMTSHHQDSVHYTVDLVGDVDENLFYQGFSFENRGPNEIVTTQPDGLNYANRDFAFSNLDRAKKDTFLWVTDYNGSGKVSDYFETIIVFLPRENQMHIEEGSSDLIVTLTTGEEVRFDKKTKMIISGVLSEAPLDFNPDRTQRKYADLKYSGKGIMLRSDARASDPRLAPTLQVIKKNLKPCPMPSKIFWTQEGFPKFRFISDEEVYVEIKNHCGTEYLP